MAAGVERVSSKKVITLESLEDVATEWLPQEIRDTASEIALEENRGQVIQGNFPNRVVIDKRAIIDLKPEDVRDLTRAGARIRFKGLDSNIRFFYTDTEVFKAAVSYASRLLINLTRVLTGTARESYYFWCSNPDNKKVNRKYETISGVRKWLDENNGPLISVRILGPTIEYRRMVIYNPEGRRQQTRWVSSGRAVNRGSTIDRFRFTQPTKSKVNPRAKTDNIAVRRASRGKKVTYQVRVAKAIQQIVIQNTQRQFRDVSVKYRFVKSRELPLPVKTDWKPTEGNENIPELSIWLKTRRNRRR